MADSKCITGASPPPPQPVAAIKYGVTKPISLAGPTEADIQRNAELEKVEGKIQFHYCRNCIFSDSVVGDFLKFLITSGLYESKEETARREEVLSQINEVSSLPCSSN